MRALTVQQPWAWAIVHGGKDVENRSRNVAGSYRGPVAIHAGQRLASGDAFATVERLAPGAAAGLSVLTAGAIIGVAKLVEVHPADLCQGNCSWWAEPQGMHLGFIDPEPLAEPIRCRGQLGLWTPPAEVLAELEAALPVTSTDRLPTVSPDRLPTVSQETPRTPQNDCRPIAPLPSGGDSRAALATPAPGTVSH